MIIRKHYTVIEYKILSINYHNKCRWLRLPFLNTDSQIESKLKYSYMLLISETPQSGTEWLNINW